MARGDTERAVWQALNARQQLYLESIFNADQAREAGRRADRAGGIWSSTPASEWRQIDAFHEPASPRDLVGVTELQLHWESFGHHDQGTGSTLKILTGQGLVTMGQRGTRFGVMHTVAMTTRGRAVVRAGLGLGTSGPVAGLLPRRQVEVLALLATSDTLAWGFSATIEKLTEHRPPFAEGGYRHWRATEEGRRHYREHCEQYRTAYPDLTLPPPDGEQEPWPVDADLALDGLAGAAYALHRAIENTAADLARARADLAEQQRRKLDGRHSAAERTERAWHKLLTSQAEARIALRERQHEELSGLLDGAVAAYATAALAVLAAVAADAGHREVTAAARGGDAGANLRKLAAPAPLGIPAFDTEAARLHRLARSHRSDTVTSKGKPKSRTGPAACYVPRELYGTRLEAPWALAGHIRENLRDGLVLRERDRQARPPARPRPFPGALPAPALRLLGALTDPARATWRTRFTEIARDLDTTAHLDGLPAEGLLPYQVREVTSGKTAAQTLVDGGLAALVDADVIWPRETAEERLALLTATDAGRRHLVQHLADYRELHPTVDLPDLTVEVTA